VQRKSLPEIVMKSDVVVVVAQQSGAVPGIHGHHGHGHGHGVHHPHHGHHLTHHHSANLLHASNDRSHLVHHRFVRIYGTVNASNYGPRGNFGPFLARSVAFSELRLRKLSRETILQQVRVEV
jgi:hypothetical protein